MSIYNQAVIESRKAAELVIMYRFECHCPFKPDICSCRQVLLIDQNK